MQVFPSQKLHWFEGFNILTEHKSKSNNLELLLWLTFLFCIFFSTLSPSILTQDIIQAGFRPFCRIIYVTDTFSHGECDNKEIHILCIKIQNESMLLISHNFNLEYLIPCKFIRQFYDVFHPILDFQKLFPQF